MGEIPGRPAYLCTILSCDFSEMVLSKISSQDQVFNTIATKQDRKAQKTKSIRVHNSVTNYLTKTQST